MTESLDTLLADGIIEAVIGQLKTGKEAEVWLVQHAGQVVAAKLYKERHERNFRNNVGYREGREVRNSRTRRAMEKGSRFGQAAAEDAWKSAEADSLYKLHAQGVRVPTPVMFYEGVLLMEVVVDATGHPAPRLVEAPPTTPEEAEALYLDLRGQVIRTLSSDLIHGDLSPYNILMSWQGPTLIDFPQTVAAARNNRAEFYFRRDLDNVRDFLAAWSPRVRAMAGDSGEIWNAYVRRDLTPDFVPSGTFREAPRRNGPQGRNGVQGSRDGRSGVRPERGAGPGRREDFAAEPVAQAVPPPAPDASPVDAEEAELRALEALVLRQGGGERSRPPVSSGPRDGRKRGFGPNKNAPRSGGNGGGARPPGSGGPPRNAGGAPRPPGEQRGGNGSRPPGGEQRVGGGSGGGGSSRPQQAGGPRTPPGEQRNGNGLNARPQHERQRGNGAPRPPREGGNPRPPVNGSHAGGESRPPMNGQPLEGGMGANSRPPMNGPRANGSPRPPRDGQRDGANRPPRGERRGAEAGGPQQGSERGAPNGSREQRSGGPGNGGGPRAPRQGPERGGPRPQRSGPQVSYVGRPVTSNVGSPETGS